MFDQYGTLLAKEWPIAKVVFSFLHGRMRAVDTYRWALSLKASDRAERVAIAALIDREKDLAKIGPWLDAWRLLEASWAMAPKLDQEREAYRCQQRMRSGERSRFLIKSIAASLSPFLKLDAASATDRTGKVRRVRKLEDIVYSQLDSRNVAERGLLGLQDVVEVDFVSDLARELDNVLTDALSLAREFGWGGGHELWRLGSLYYVGYRGGEDGGAAGDIDQFHRGIAPIVKALHASVARLAELDVSSAIRIVDSWSGTSDPVHLRLWAAMKASDVGFREDDAEALLHIADREFWDVHAFPEIAEFRSQQFNRFDDASRAEIEARLMRGPSRSFWRKDLDRDRVKVAKRFWSLRELRRIQAVGGVLSLKSSAWVARYEGDYPELRAVRADYGFPDSGHWTEPRQELGKSFDGLEGAELLQAIYSSFATTDPSWNFSPFDSARLWLGSQGNAIRLANYLGQLGRVETDLRAVWANVASAHARLSPEDAEARRSAEELLVFLDANSNELIAATIEQTSDWLNTWAGSLGRLPSFARVWMRACEAAANVPPDDSQKNDPGSVSENAVDVAAFNSAVGRLAGAFVSIFAATDGIRVADDPLLVQMSMCLLQLPRPARHTAILRLISDLAFFIGRDEDWTRENLISALNEVEGIGSALWVAIARQAASPKIVTNLDDKMLRRCLDVGLTRESRVSLGSGVVWEHLRSTLWGADYRAPHPLLTQTIRAVEPEVRVGLAKVVERFMTTVVRNNQGIEGLPDPATIYRRVIEPFLRDIWPSDISLVSSGVSSAFAGIPALCGEAMVDAVDQVIRFIVPFDCWSLADFGFWSDRVSEVRMADVKTADQVLAIVQLLSASIGDAEGSVIPYDLSLGLAHFKKIDPSIESTRDFRRLAALARN